MKIESVRFRLSLEKMTQLSASNIIPPYMAATFNPPQTSILSEDLCPSGLGQTSALKSNTTSPLSTN